MCFLKYSFLFTLLFFVSCDDGDIIVSDFDFENNTLESCYSGEDDDQTVFFNVNADSDEVIFVIIDGEFDFEEEFDSTIDSSSDVIGDDTNLFRYIKFDSFTSADTEDYFCSAIASNLTIERQLNGDGGTLSIVTTNTVELDGDEDNDGLTNEQEGYIEDTPAEDFNTLLDSDQDGIPDFRDQDDDNDNVATRNELYNLDTDGEDITTDEDEDGIPDVVGFLDTDGDGNLDYLDTDDDGDGTPTRLEFVEASSIRPESNFNGSDQLALYLDPTEAVAGTHVDTPIMIDNSYTTSFETIVRIDNLELSGNGEGTITRDLVIGEKNDPSTVVQRVLIYSDNTFETLNTVSSADEIEEPTGTGDPIVEVPNDEVSDEEETETP